MLTSLLPQILHLIFMIWAAAVAPLRVPLHSTFPAQRCSFSSPVATAAAAKQSGENQTAQATRAQHSNSLKMQQSQKA